VQLNGPSTFAWLLHDIDRPDAILAHRDANLPHPNFIAVNPENGHAHCGMLLSVPVARHHASRLDPLRLYAAVDLGFTRRLGADMGYSGLIVKNPMHEAWRVEWRIDRPYDLGELEGWLFEPDMRPMREPERQLGAGRNVVLFEGLSSRCYRDVRQFKKSGASFEQWHDHVSTIAQKLNAEFVSWLAPRRDGLMNAGPLPAGEVRATAKSVAKWVWHRFTLGGFSAAQSRRGIAGNTKRWAGHEAVSRTKPWETEGVSRATWYRRRAKPTA